MSQNRAGVYWSREEVDQRLRAIMRHIHDVCLETIRTYNLPAASYHDAANIAGFERVAVASGKQGI
ncbi:hypothetical protein [Nitritalea halalkaliphila]|uniref:hypothetical protein n=1 Tax=Nitritalea halalkaliphila TaxID=590849 RepID=UPI0002FDD6F1|nr:hypothetical protein [Nitritalea halalkaliphila]